MNVLDPAGPQAATIAQLWWLMLAACALVWLLVVVALAAAVRRATRAPKKAEAEKSAEAEHAEEHRLMRWVGGAVGASVLVLIGLLVASAAAGRSLSRLRADDPLGIEVVGHQWWWEVRYGDPRDPSRGTVTANEIHLPVGREVRLELRSTDVIHSFWVPALHGKTDLIPGHVNAVWLRADRPGVYRGQCAEFCGHQHAKMGLLVVAEPPDRFAAWLNAQGRPARPPANTLQRRGQEVFLAGACPLCHTIAGTDAGGKTAPDLTHLASRRTLAAATLPNTRGHLAGWIVDPQRVKPGNYMPGNSLRSADLQALLAYLRSLE